MTRRRPSDIDIEAARHVARMDRDDWSDAQERELRDWLARDPRHSGALLRAQAAWMTFDPPRPAQAGQFDTPERRKWPSRRNLLAGGGAAIAASFAGALMLGGGTSYATSVGEIRRVPLADGSIAAINTASTIEVKLDDAARHVRVEQGEAWFQVAKDKQRPFVVAAGRARVRAVGTAFSVRRRAGGADVLVTEGEVEVWADGAEGHRVRLRAGARGFIADDAAIVQQPAAPSAIDRALAWRSGKVDLAGDRLDSAVAEFNRYNQRRLAIADPAIAGERLDGVFRTDDPEGFAQAVRITLGVPVDLSDPAQIRIGSPAR
ncbi:FecR domain-containing protein [Sphingopyxis sp. GW247-27LB]|uniref:FecR family protein n=1 Tax=Sphingopyxis sp. GW247-27LB TaxID=2012632 RepID=UPI000BA5DAB0|nr:FecR domain-containing protein [Sphingopyxis sp. GW247-27LB]PAL21471.1 iron dicitrate transport regulator FecR [Sphingopyxis sp. GW247-27LB]